MSLTIRRAVRADLQTVWSLIHLLAEHQGHLHELTATPDDIDRALFGDRPLAYCELAELDGEAAGCAIWFHSFSTWTGRSGVYLEDLIVRDAARGAGVGAVLVAHLARLTVEAGLPRIEWIVMKDNPRGAAFHARMGGKLLDDQDTWRLDGAALAALAARAAD